MADYVVMGEYRCYAHRCGAIQRELYYGHNYRRALEVYERGKIIADREGLGVAWYLYPGGLHAVELVDPIDP